MTLIQFMQQNPEDYQNFSKLIVATCKRYLVEGDSVNLAKRKTQLELNVSKTVVHKVVSESELATICKKRKTNSRGKLSFLSDRGIDVFA